MVKAWSSMEKFGGWLAEAYLPLWFLWSLQEIFICWLLFPGEAIFRQTGVLMQLGGTLIVLYDLNNKPSLFDHPRLIERAMNWYERRPWHRRNVHLIPLSIHAVSTGFSPGVATASASSFISLDERVLRLEKELSIMSEHLKKEIDRVEEFVSTSIDKEKNERLSKINDLKSMLFESQMGNFDVSLLGLAWITSGGILSGLSVEIHCIFNGGSFSSFFSSWGLY